MMDLGWIGDIVQSVQAQNAQDKNLVNQWASWDLASRAVRHGERREDNAIQRRVADARAAGIHPLFALGANVQNNAAVPLFDSAPVFNETPGRGLGTALTKILSKKDDELHDAQVDLLRSQAEYYRSRADGDDFVSGSAVSSGLARGAQRANSQQDQGEPVKIYDMPLHSKEQFGRDIEAWKKATGRKGDYDVVEGPFGYTLHKRSRGKAQEHEDVYGEMSDFIVGPPMYLKDTMETKDYEAFRKTGRERYKRNLPFFYLYSR